MTQPDAQLYRYVDGDGFCLSARLLPDLNTGGVTETLSITVEGSDEPQSAHVPVGDVSAVLFGISRAAGQQTAPVLPAPDPRAAILAEAADHLLTLKPPPNYTGVHGLMFSNGVQAAGEELRRLAGEARQDPHVCKPSAGYYYCPTSARVESDCHGSFDVCCDRPELHMPQREARQDEAPGAPVPVGGLKGNPFDYHPEDDEARYGQPETDGEA